MPSGEDRLVRGSDALLRRIQDQDESSHGPRMPRSDRQLGVRAQVQRNLQEIFEPISDAPFRLNPFVHDDGEELRAGRFEVVSWEWVGVHKQSFLGVPPTGRLVWIRAMTVVEPGEGDEGDRYQDFVDWHRVLVQLGVSPQATRPIVDAEDFNRLRPR